MVIPVFYYVDPSDVRKQTGKFGKVFEETCKGKQEDDKQRWIQALTDVANMAGEDICNGPTEADMVEKIANDISNKLITSSNGFGDSVGIEAHIEAMESVLCLESEEARMVGIWGQSGIGKSTLGRALFSHLSPKFPFRNFTTYKHNDKLSWEQNFLSEILGQKDLKIENSGVVKERFKDKKVLIVLDDVVNPLFLDTLVGKSEWFGPGSRIIVITQDMHILKGHKIDLLYEVKIPAQDIALMMLCRSAFAQDSPPEGFKELAVEVTRLAGDLPLGLRVLGYSLKGRTKKEWMELLPGLQNGLSGDIMETLKAGVKRLAEKSLIRITPNEDIVEMHNLLEKLGREIVRTESKGNPPGKHRFLMDADEILDVFTNHTGSETLLGIFFSGSVQQQPQPFISMDEKSFKKMINLQFLRIHDLSISNEPILHLPNGLVYLPPKLKWLYWDKCPLKCLPSNFKAEFLVHLRMENSKLEKLWEGTQQLGSLKTIIMHWSRYLKEIPDLSRAMNLERVDFSDCNNLESFPSPINWKSLEYLNLIGCLRLKNFPQLRMESFPHGIEIHVYDCFWNKNLLGLDYLDCLRKCYPSKFLPEHLVRLEVKGTMMEMLWKGVQSLGSLQKMDLSYSLNLKEIPDLSTATNLVELDLSNCKSLVRLPSTIRNLQKLEILVMEKCTGLEVLPVDVNLSYLKTLNLNGCSSLKSFPQLSGSIEYLNLDHTAIEEVPCFIEMFRRLTRLWMRGCYKLKNISPNIFKLTNLRQVDFTDCGGIITALSDSALVATIEDPYGNIEERNKDKYNRAYKYSHWYFNFRHCFKLNRDARELIIQSSLKWTMVLPGGEVPTCFKHRAHGNSLTLTLPQSSLSHQFLRFNVCVVVEPLAAIFARLYLQFRFNDVSYKHSVDVGMPQMWKDHLFFFSFKFQPTSLPSKLDFSDVEFKFEDFMGIKEFGIRLLNVYPSLDGCDGRSSKTEYNQKLGEKCDVAETERNNKKMQMTSSVSSYPCLEGEDLCIDSMITKQQDAQIPIVEPSLESDFIWLSSSSTSSARSTSSSRSAKASSSSICSCWGGLLKRNKSIR